VSEFAAFHIKVRKACHLAPQRVINS